MESERQVPKERGEELATKLKMLFFETSAKENININETFETLSRQVLRVVVQTKIICYLLLYLFLIEGRSICF